MGLDNQVGNIRPREDGEQGNFNSSIRQAKSTADNFLTEVKGIEKELLAENLQLTVTIALRDATIGVLNTIITFLKTQVANKPDCEEEEMELEFSSDELGSIEQILAG